MHLIDLSRIPLQCVQKNKTRARLGWTFSYICCIFVHPNLDSVSLFVGMWERSICYLFIYLLGGGGTHCLSWRVHAINARSGCCMTFYTMPEKIQPIRIQVNNYIFNGITPKLPIFCHAHVPLIVLATVFSMAGY